MPSRLCIRTAALLILAGAVLWPSQTSGQVLVSKETLAAPTEVAEPLRALLSPDAVVVTVAGTRLEFWWVKNLDLASSPSGAPSWTHVAEGAFVGALRLAQPRGDVRNFTMKPGVYTLRYALQPQNGDHVGISPYREFLIVGPATADKSPLPAGYDGAVALGKTTLNRAHPAALSLDPPATDGPALSVVANDAGHQSVLIQVPAAHGGKPAGVLTFGVIVQGTIEH
jgi:hypothetical protein